MKRCVFVLACVGAFAAAPASAQDLSVGIKGGLIRSSVKATGIDDLDPSASNTLSAGASVGVPLGGRFQFQPELLFSKRRFTAPAGSSSIAVESRTVDVPLLLAVHGSGRLQPMVYAGPQFNFRSKIEQVAGATTMDLSDQVRRTDVNVTFGGGVAAKAGRGAVTLEGRVQLGVRDLSVSEGDSLKTRAVSLLAGYRF